MRALPLVQRVALAARHGTLSGRRLFATAILAAAAGCECPGTQYARVYDLATYCHDYGTCQLPTGVGASPGTGGDNVFAVGMFELGPNEPVVVPAADFRQQIAAKPLLAVELRAGAPLSQEAAQVTFDQAPASCAPVPSGISQNVFLNCTVPADVDQIGFVYSGQGLGQGTGWAGFSLSLYLEEATPTGVQHICAE